MDWFLRQNLPETHDRNPHISLKKKQKNLGFPGDFSPIYGFFQKKKTSMFRPAFAPSPSSHFVPRRRRSRRFGKTMGNATTSPGSQQRLRLRLICWFLPGQKSVKNAEAEKDGFHQRKWVIWTRKNCDFTNANGAIQPWKTADFTPNQNGYLQWITMDLTKKNMWKKCAVIYSRVFTHTDKCY